MTLEYYVYILLDSSKPGEFSYGEFKFDYEPFYVGKGKSSRIKNTLYDKSPFKKRKISKLKKLGFEVLSIKLFENLSSSDALQKEIEIISLIGRRNLNLGPLVNLTDGGDGRLKSPHSQKSKDKISRNRKGKGVGWKHSEKTLKLMSKNQTGEGNGFFGKTHTDKVKKEQSERVSGLDHPFFGKSHSEETLKVLKNHRKENISDEKIKEACQKFNKIVQMYDLDLNFISEFESVKNASIQTGINESIISKCCRGDIKSPTRYYFRYKMPEDNIKNNKFLVNINDKFLFSNKVYKLIKRNKKTCICETNNQLETLHESDYPFLFQKEKNDINLVEIFLFLKKLDTNFRIKNDIIFNGKIKVRFIKLIENSELFNVSIYDDKSDIIIFEDEWEQKKSIVKSRLRNILKKSNKIFARKCEIKEVKDNKLVKDFLDKNHLQGSVRSKIKIGLFYEGELISLMTFGSLRKNLGFKSKERSFELLRFCSKINYSIVGASSRLLNFFIENYQVDYILSYSDNRWGSGNVYKKMGFSFVGKTIPNYYYIVDNVRKNRFNYRKDVLVDQGHDESKTEVQIMNELGHFRIFDKGSNKFELININ